MRQRIKDLGDGKIPKWVDPSAKVWPDADAPDKTENSLGVQQQRKYQWHAVHEGWQTPYVSGNGLLTKNP